MKKHFFSAVKVLFFLGLGIFLIWLVTKNLTPEDKEKIKAAFIGANYWWLLLSGVFALASHYLRAVRWNMLLAPMGYYPSSLNSFFAVMIGYLANLAVPRLGEVTRCGILNRYEKIPIHKSIGTVVTERATDLIVLFLIFIIVTVTQLEKLSGYANEYIIMPAREKLSSSLSGGFFLVILLIIAIALASLFFFFRNRLLKLPFVQKIMEMLKGFLEGLRSIRQLKSPLLYLFHSLFIWFMYLMMLYACFFCLSETSELGFGAAITLLAFGSLAIIATPGGIGAYPPVVRGILALYFIESNIGLAFGWIAWSGQTLLVLIGGLLSLVLLPVLNRADEKQ